MSHRDKTRSAATALMLLLEAMDNRASFAIKHLVEQERDDHWRHFMFERDCIRQCIHLLKQFRHNQQGDTQRLIDRIKEAEQTIQALRSSAAEATPATAADPAQP